MKLLENTITSLVVAEMVGREHNNVMKDIRRIIEQLGEVKSYQSYFIESTYTSTQNREMPCYLLTKKGCELYANRMTGEKGTQFAVTYIEKFNEMEQQVQQTVPQVSQAELIAMMAQQNVEQEQRISVIEQKQEDIKQVFTTNVFKWREKVQKIVNTVARNNGGTYRQTWQKTYSDLESRARCDLDRRLENMRNRARKSGAGKKVVDNINNLDVIDADQKLTEIYLTIIKELALKHGLNFTEKGGIKK